MPYCCSKPRRDLTADENQRLTEEILDALDPVERHRFRSVVIRDYWDFENVYFQSQRGLVSESYWNDRIVPSIQGNAPSWKALFNGRLPTGGRPEFNEEVERILREAQ